MNINTDDVQRIFTFNIKGRIKVITIFFSSLAIINMLMPKVYACNPDVIPSDFKIIAHFSPGFSPWKPWDITIIASGDVQQKIFPGLRDDTAKPEMKSYKLSQQDLENLIHQVSEAQFLKLKSKYSRRETDGSTLWLTITMAGKTHKVSVYFPEFLASKSAVRRFLRVWDEVLKMVPSPNDGQIPGSIKPIKP